MFLLLVSYLLVINIFFKLHIRRTIIDRTLLQNYLLNPIICAVSPVAREKDIYGREADAVVENVHVMASLHDAPDLRLKILYDNFLFSKSNIAKET